MYVEEDYSKLNLGPDPDSEETAADKEGDGDGDDDDDNNNIIFETPKRLTTRNPPFEIMIDFDQYRRKREYKGAML